MAAGKGCTNYNNSRSDCLKHYQNPGGNEAGAYGTGNTCAWNTGSSKPCKNNGNSCEVASTPAVADLMDKNDYCLKMENGDYIINKGTKDCKKFDKEDGENSKAKCQLRFHYVGGNESGRGITKTCRWHGGDTCTNDGATCLREVAPSGDTVPTADDDD